MAASLDDILTTQRNGVIAINNLGQKLALIEADLPCVCTNLAIIAAASFPATTSATVAASTTTLITAGTGRVFSVSIPVHAGSAQVYIYDSATTGGISATNLSKRELGIHQWYSFENRRRNELLRCLYGQLRTPCPYRAENLKRPSATTSLR